MECVPQQAAAAAEVAVARSKPSLASSTQFVSLARVFLDGGCFVQILVSFSRKDPRVD